MLVKFLINKSLVKAGEIVDLAEETATSYIERGIVVAMLSRKTKNADNSNGDK